MPVRLPTRCGCGMRTPFNSLLVGDRSLLSLSTGWVYTSAELQLLLDKLWTSLCVADTVGKLAKCAPCPQFPYHSCDSEGEFNIAI
jgi:hypothetical protein